MLVLYPSKGAEGILKSSECTCTMLPLVVQLLCIFDVPWLTIYMHEFTWEKYAVLQQYTGLDTLSNVLLPGSFWSIKSRDSSMWLLCTSTFVEVEQLFNSSCSSSVAHSPHDLPSESAVKKKLLPRSTGFTVWLSNMVKALIPVRRGSWASQYLELWHGWDTHDDSRAACPSTPLS